MQYLLICWGLEVILQTRASWKQRGLRKKIQIVKITDFRVWTEHNTVCRDRLHSVQTHLPQNQERRVFNSVKCQQSCMKHASFQIIGVAGLKLCFLVCLGPYSVWMQFYTMPPDTCWCYVKYKPKLWLSLLRMITNTKTENIVSSEIHLESFLSRFCFRNIHSYNPSSNSTWHHGVMLHSSMCFFNFCLLSVIVKAEILK